MVKALGPGVRSEVLLFRTRRLAVLSLSGAHFNYAGAATLTRLSFALI